MQNENGGIVSSSSKEANRKSGDEAKDSLMASATTGAKQLSEVAKEAGVDAAAQAKDFASQRIGGQKARAAESLGSVAAALRETGERLQSGDNGGVTDYVVKAADRLEQASGYLKERDLSGVLHDVGDFARREPALFLGGAFVVGLAGGRFFKSSHRSDEHGRSSASQGLDAPVAPNASQPTQGQGPRGKRPGAM